MSWFSKFFSQKYAPAIRLVDVDAREVASDAVPAVPESVQVVNMSSPTGWDDLVKPFERDPLIEPVTASGVLDAVPGVIRVVNMGSPTGWDDLIKPSAPESVVEPYSSGGVQVDDFVGSPNAGSPTWNPGAGLGPLPDSVDRDRDRPTNDIGDVYRALTPCQSMLLD